MITLTLSILMLPSSAKRLQRNIVVAACCYDDTARWMSADTAPGVRTKKIRDIRIKLDAGGETAPTPGAVSRTFRRPDGKSSALFALVATVSAVELTPANWDAETGGKTVFIKFQAPW